MYDRRALERRNIRVDTCILLLLINSDSSIVGSGWYRIDWIIHTYFTYDSVKES